MGVASITVVGNLGRDPETREVGDTTVCQFSVAYNRRKGGEEFTDWYNVEAWGKLGELCQEYLTKGRTVAVAGQLAQRTYEKDGVEHVSIDVRATDVHFMGSKSEPSDAGTAQDGEPSVADDPDDDIPF